jgi:hypothetical protein
MATGVDSITVPDVLPALTNGVTDHEKTLKRRFTKRARLEVHKSLLAINDDLAETNLRKRWVTPNLLATAMPPIPEQSEASIAAIAGDTVPGSPSAIKISLGKSIGRALKSLLPDGKTRSHASDVEDRPIKKVSKDVENPAE